MPFLWAVLCAVCAALHGFYYLPAGPADDDFIYYRYARNWVEGLGLVFNPGQRVEGATSPLCVLLDAAALLGGLAPWHASQGLSILALGAAAFATSMLWYASRPAARWPVPGLLVAASPALAFHAAAGLGTTLLAGLLALWAWRWVSDVQRGRCTWLTAAILGTAGLARAEALVFAIPYALLERKRGGGWKALIAFVPLAAWTLFRLAYYGALLPVTYHVKKLPFFVDLGYGLDYLGRGTLLTGVGIAVALSFVGHRERTAQMRACAWGLLGFTLFVVYVGGDYLPFSRFFVPVLPIAYWLASEGVAALLSNAPRVQTAVAALSIAFLQWPQGERRDVFALHEQHEERWIRIGKALQRVVVPDQSIALGPVGAIGYFSNLEVVDILGMTNDAVWHGEPDLSVDMKGHHRYDADWVLAQEPDILMLGNGVFLEGTTSLPVLPYERGLLESTKDRYRAMVIEIPESYPLVFFLREGSREPIGSRPIARR